MTQRWQIFSLLCQLLGNKDLEITIKTVNAQGLWPPILRESSFRLVSTNLYWVLHKNNLLWQTLPQDVQDYLLNIFILNQQRNEKLLEQSKNIILTLNKVGIHPLILKSTAQLLTDRTPDIGYRLQTDIDIVVQTHELGLAGNTLLKSGYHFAEEIHTADGIQLSPSAPDNVDKLIALYKNHQHLPPFVNKNHVASVELHRHIYSKRFRRKYTLSKLFANAKLLTKDDLSYKILNAQDEAEHLINHSYINDGNTYYFNLPLRQACDWLQIKQHASIKHHNSQADLFDGLVQQLLLKQKVKSTSVKWHIFWMKQCSRFGIIEFIVNLLGRCRHALGNIYHDPQKLRKHWQLRQQKHTQ